METNSAYDSFVCSLTQVLKLLSEIIGIEFIHETHGIPTISEMYVFRNLEQLIVISHTVVRNAFLRIFL